MKRKLLTMLLCVMTLGAWAATETNPTAVVNLVNRVCGSGASSNFTFTLDDTFNGGAEAFQLGAANGKVTVTANTMSALTCGLNWYLNHEAHVNIAWNNLTQTVTSFPAPTDTQLHTARGKYRYYLNYCTFSYSMSFWDEDRWMKEVDWMALHGVNLPLQIVGMDAVWYYMLREQFGFSHDEASGFVAGPAFQGWWLMNNLTGHGGKNPEWWYARQAELGRKITDRMRELGMAPCLPGYVGMAPQKYVTDKGATSYTGSWCGFTAPLLLVPGDAYTAMAAQYYAYIQSIFGFMPTSFSIDPAHERGVPSGMNYQDACDAARAAMNAASPNALWVAQEWQVNASQSRINALPVENTLLLDLSSERVTYTNEGYQNSGSGYGAREYLFCMLHNYGGNVGMYGCMMQMLSNYSSHLTTGIANGSNGTLMGVGATPEGIETNPVLYDLLFELPWLSTVPTADQWLADYTISRYGTDNANAKAAWENLRTTVYASTNSDQQGCREPVFCARPNLSGNGASSWAGATYDWDKNKVIEAAEKLLSVGASGTNYEYDVVDFVRQAITDYAHTLQMDMAGQTPTGTRFAEQADGFLAMMDDVDELLGTISDFRMGKWAGAARKIATESGNKVYGTGTWSANAADANWLELNSRMLVTTWGNTGAATNQGGLRDYGNREWQGLIRDYYKPRWVRYFNDMKTNGSCGVTAWAWMAQYEWPYIYGKTIGTTMSDPSADLYADASGLTYPQTYSATHEGNPLTVATAKFHKYFGKLSNGKYYSPNVSHNFATGSSKIGVGLHGKTAAQVLSTLDGIFTTKTTGSSIVSYTFDENGDGNFTETVYTDGSLPTLTGARKCRVTTSDGALITIIANFDGDEIEYDPTWPAITAKDRDANAVSQYVSRIKVNNKTVYTKSSNLNLADEADGPHIIIESLDVPAVGKGQTVTVQWAGTDGLKNTYCSVYFDKNANHDFEHTSSSNTECLGYVGSKGAANTAVCNGTVTFTIPDDMPNGITCVRLRFDGAWMESNLANCTNSSISVPCLQSGSTATGTAVNPNHTTNRTTYDIHLLVSDDVEVGVSDFDDNKVYTLKTERGYIPASSTGAFNSTNDADAAARFRITYFYGSYYLYNIDQNKYLAANGSAAAPYVDTPDGTFSIYPASEVAGGSAGMWIIQSDDNANNSWLMFGGSNQFINNNNYKTADAGDQWIIKETTMSRRDWPDLTANATERLTTMWAKQITINGQDLFDSEQTSDPGAFVKIPVSSKTTIAQDSDLRLGWNFNITGARATVYLDKNADYDFDDAGECIGTVRKFGANGNEENSRAQTLTGDDAIVIPMSELPLGETVLRVRFDGAWLTPNTSVGGNVVHEEWFEDTATATDLLNPTGAKTYAFLPEIGATRVAYDIHINVVKTEQEPDPEPEVSKWTLVEASDARANEISNVKVQYLRKIMLNGTTVHTASTGEGIAVNTVVPTEVSVQAGKILKVQFVGNASNMRFTYMTAYLDYNSDGDFLDAGECIGTLGSKGAQDARLEGSEANPVTFYIRIPDNATLGETNLRLRFDGAWMSIDGPANSTTDVLTGNATTPMLPQSATNRNAYDIHLNIVANDGLPIFSTVDNPFWYMLKGNGNNFVGDVGANEKLQVCSRDDIAPEELWQFIGDNTAGFKMRNAAGRYVGYVTENNVKLCVATTEDNATLFTYSGAMDNCQFPMKENSSLKFRIQGTGVGNIVDIINADGAYTKFAIIEPTPVNLPSFYSAETSVASRTWYSCNLTSGTGLSLAQNGEDVQLAIKQTQNDDHEQVWSLIGTDHTNFKMVNGNGRYVGWDGTNFVDTDADNAVSLRLRASYTSSAIDGLAIQRIGSSNWNCVNATSASTDAQLHEGGKDAANSKFSFAEAPTPRQLPTFSTVTNPVYYQVEFARNNKHHVLSQPTSGNNLVTANSDDEDTKQMWQLIGSKSNFKLRAINGNYVGFSGGRFTTVANEADAVSLCLVVHGDSNFEIRRVAEGVTNGMNMTGYAGGDEFGQELGEWNYLDVNNELNFVIVEANLSQVADLVLAQKIYNAFTSLPEAMRVNGVVGNYNAANHITQLEAAINNTDYDALPALLDAIGRTPNSFDNNKLYAIKNVNSGNYLENVGDRPWSQAKRTNSTYDPTNESFQWMVYNDGVGTVLYGVGSRGALDSNFGHSGIHNVWGLTTLADSKSDVYVIIQNVQNTSYYTVYDPDHTEQTNNADRYYLHENINYNYGITNWSNGGTASRWYFVQIGEASEQVKAELDVCIGDIHYDLPMLTRSKVVTAPVAGKRYFIAAQRIIGTKWQDLYLYKSDNSNQSTQSRQLSAKCIWTAESYDGGIAMRNADGMYLGAASLSASPIKLHFSAEPYTNDSRDDGTNMVGIQVVSNTRWIAAYKSEGRENSQFYTADNPTGCSINHNDLTVLYKLYEVDNYDNVGDADENKLNPYRIRFTNSGKYLTVSGLNMEPGCGHLQVTGQADVPDFDPNTEILADNSTVWMLRGGTLNNFMLRSSARRYIAWQNNEYVTVDDMQDAAHFRLLVSPNHMQLQRIADDDNVMHRGEGSVIDDQSTDNIDTYVEFVPVEQKARPITVQLAGTSTEGVTITVSGEKVVDTGNGTYTVNGDAMLTVNNLPARHQVVKWTRKMGDTEVFIPGYAKEVMVTPWTDGITYTAYIETDDAYPWSIVTAANGRTNEAIVGAIYIDDFSTPIWKQEKVVDDVTTFDLETPNDVQTVVLGNPTTGALTVTQGENMMVRWVSNIALANMRLSAFIDRNGDGTFTPITANGKGDCLGFMGCTDKHAAEYMVGTADAPAGFNITLPIDITGGDDGLTTLRLRFDKHDQATNNASKVPFLIAADNAENNGYAVASDNQTTGMVFDIRVSVKPATVWQPIRVMDRSRIQHQGTFSALEYSENGFAEKIDQQYHFDGYVNSAGDLVPGHLANITPKQDTINGKIYTVFACNQFQEGKHYAEVENDNWEHWYVTEYVGGVNNTANERHYHYHMYSMRGTVHLKATPNSDGKTKCLGWWRRIYDNHPGTNPNAVTFTETRISSASDVWVTPSAKTEPYYIEYYTKFAAEVPIMDGKTNTGFKALPNGDEVVINDTTYMGVTAIGDGAGYKGTTFDVTTFRAEGENFIITEYDPHFMSKNNTVKTVKVGKHVTSVGETYNSYVPHAYYVNHHPKGNGSGSGGTAEDFNGSTYYFEVYNLNDVMGVDETSNNYQTLHPDRVPAEHVIMRRPYRDGTTEPIAYNELTKLSVLRDPSDPVYKLIDEAGTWNVRLRYSIPDKYTINDTEYTVEADSQAPTGVKVNGSDAAADNNWSFSSHNHFALLATGPDSYDSFNEFNVVLPRRDYAENNNQNPYLQVQTQVNQSGTGQQVIEDRTYYFRKTPLRASTKKPIVQYRDIENIPEDERVTLADLIGREVELELQYRLGGRLRFNLYTDLGLRACVDVETEAHELRDLMRLCCSMTPGATVEHCTFDYIEDPVSFTRVRETYEPIAEADYKGEPKYSTQNWILPDNVLGDRFEYSLTDEEKAVVNDHDALDAKLRAHYYLDDTQGWELRSDNTKVRLQMNNHANDAQLRASNVFANDKFWSIDNTQVAFTANYGTPEYNDRYSVINMLGDPDAEPLPIDMNWTFDCTFYPVKDKAFNTHGSVILGTGTDGSKNTWPNGFQFYFTYQTEGDTRTRGHATDDGLPGTDSQGYFTLKANAASNVNFDASHPLGNDSQYDFNSGLPAVIHVYHDGDNPRAVKENNVVTGYEYSTYFKVTQGNRVLLEYTTWVPIHTIREFCTNVPAGSRMEDVTLHGWKDDRSVPVLAGMAVEEIKVDPKNKFFSSHRGALFDKYGHLLLFMPLNKEDDLDKDGRVLALMKDETECDANCSHSEHIYAGEGNKQRHVSLAEVSRKAFRGWQQDDENNTIPQAQCLLAVDMFQYGFIECLKPENAALQLDEKSKWTEEEIIQRMKLIGSVAEFGRIEINRTLTQDKLNIVSMPFNVNEDEINQRYGGWAYELYDIEGVDETKVYVRMKRVTHMRAGQPYLVKPVPGVKYVSHANTSLRTYTTEQRKIEKTAAVENEYSGKTSGVEMQANYAMKQVPTGVYFYNSANNKFYRYTYDREVILNGFRGTLALTTTEVVNNAPVKKLDLKRSLSFAMMAFDDTPSNETAIEELPATVVFKADPINVYDLNGNLIRKDCTDLDPLENLPRGVYIVGGRKMIKN